MKKNVILIAALCLLFSITNAQTKHAFWDDVQTIKAYDKLFVPPQHPVLFVGSSSIRKWNDLQWAFAKHNALNRGVGGAVIDDITYYLEDIVFSYQPKQIVLYVGENDVVKADETADTIFNRTVHLYQSIRAKMPEVPIAYISMKASPSRDKYRQKVIDANLLIKNYLAKQANTAFIDVYSPMLTADGKTRPELFVSDMLHMTDKGYAIWQKAVEPYLVK